MRKMLIAAALGGMMILPACADTGYYGASYGGGYRAGDVYYDGYYGAYTDGYWGPDAYFYYRGGDGRFLRDDSRHFRREMWGNAHRFNARPYNRDHDGDSRDFRR
jgi:hypothetical protein